MAHWLTELRKKPKHVRDNIAFGTSAGVTLLIAIVVYVVMGGPDTKQVTEDQGPEFFETFLGQFKNEVASVKDAIPEETPAATETSGGPQPAPAVTIPNREGFASSSATSSTAGRTEIRTFPIKNAASTTSNDW